MSADPRELIELMKALIATLRDWAVSNNSMSEETSQGARSIGVAVEQARAYCGTLRASADQALHDAERMMWSARQAQSAAETASGDVDSTENFVAATLEKASNALALWSRKLAEARRELAAARNELALAEAEMSAARSQLWSAQAEYSSTQSAYNNCQASYTTDKDGRRQYRDCSAEAARVARARQLVSVAEARVGTAQTWVNRATIRVRAAEQQVLFCEGQLSQAVGCRDSLVALGPRIAGADRIAKEATAIAQGVVELASVAADACSRSVHEATAAQEASLLAVAAAETGQSAARELRFLAQSHAERASVAVHNLDQGIDELSQYDDAGPLGR